MSKFTARVLAALVLACSLCVAPPISFATTFQDPPSDESQAKAKTIEETPITREAQQEKTDAKSKSLDENKVDELTDNLEKRFSKNGDDKSINSDTYAAAIALRALGLSDSISVDDIIANLAADKSLSSGRLGKYITALSAAGVDCTKVLVEGKTRNLVKEMEDMLQAENEVPYSGFDNVYGTVIILPVYGSEGYKPESPDLEDELLQSILSNQITSGDYAGLFAFGGDPDSWGVQLSSQAILALQPYEARQNVASALKSTIERLFDIQNPNGSWTDSVWDTDPRGNVDATAWVICALNALGIDCTGKDARVVTANGSTPMSFLLDAANGKLDGYAEGSYNVYSEPMASSSVLMALASQRNQSTLDAPYNVYSGSIDVPKSNGKKIVAAKSPKTGDDQMGYVIYFTLAALFAGCAAVSCSLARQPKSRR